MELTKKEKREAAAEAASLSRIDTTLLGKKSMIVWLMDGNDLGYTMVGTKSQVSIYIAYRHRIFEGLTPEEMRVIRKGVDAHELLHQFLTNFDYTKELTSGMSRAEAAIFMEFANTIEDPAIEYFAPQIFGGTLLEALHFSILIIYKKSPGIGECKDAFSQLIAALIDFGDMGIVKGRFTFPEAEKYFRIVAPMYNEAITCPDSKRRLDIAKECMEATRPLWEEMVKNREAFEELLRKLLESMARSGLHLMEDSEKDLKSEDGDGSGEAEDGKKSSPASRRTATLKKIAVRKKAEEEAKSKEKPETGSDGGSSEEKSDGGSGTEQADGESKDKASDGGDMPESADVDPGLGTPSTDGGSEFVLEESEDKPEEEGKEALDIETDMPGMPGGSSDPDDEKSSEGKEGTASGDGREESDTSESGKEDGEEKTPEGESSEGEDPEGSGSSSRTTDSTGSDGSGEISPMDSIPDDADDLTEDEDKADEMAEDTFVIDDDLVEKVAEELRTEIEKEDKAARAEESDGKETDDLPDFEISSTAFRHASCYNRHVVAEVSSDALSELYRETVSDYGREIRNLTKALDEVFKGDQEESHRATSGSYNILRGSSGTTARIFDKRRDPGHLKDAAVVLAVDLSGSMVCENRIGQARKTAIVFAEALTKLKIPYYIMGYTADDRADAEHLHFVTWANKRSERESLVAMEAGGNNFDGYSIRYAASLLKGRTASNKLLVIVSDGLPECYSYRSFRVGVADTKNAIKDARKICTTFGIAVGTGCDPETMQSMYGKDFIWIKDVSQLGNMLGKKLKKLLRKE